MNPKTPAVDPSDQPLSIPPVASPRHDEALLDQAVAETFPASDPISPAVAARLEPADVSREANVPSKGAQTSGRVPLWLMLGAAAVALLAVRALFSRRDDDAEDFDDA